MPNYWGFHHVKFHITELHQTSVGRERPFKEIPTSLKVKEHDIAFLIWSREFLYGWGIITKVGEPYRNASEQSVVDVMITPMTLQQGARLDEIERVSAFNGFQWAKIDGAISIFTSEQIQILINFLPSDKPRPAVPPKEIPDGWERVDEKASGGGTASVIKVRRKADGVFGALKVLHSDYLRETKRRARVYREVISLKTLKGDGIPRLLESNAELWERGGIDLYIIMEWVQGSTLSNFLQRKGKLSINEAVLVLQKLLSALEEAHEAEIFHRDLKPENILLRDDDIASPVIVDFGLAFHKPDEEGKGNITEAGDEIGNRFLKLPEYMPGQHIFGSASDITQVVGLLFYLLTGKSPRVLRDAKERMPHQAHFDSIPKSIVEDSRWDLLNGIFNKGFQHHLDSRFQSVSELRRHLDLLVTQDADLTTAALTLEAENFDRLRKSDKHQLPQQAKQHIMKIHGTLYEALKKFAREKNLGFDDNRYSKPDKDDRIVSTMTISMYTKVPKIHVQGSHSIEFTDGQYIATYRMEGIGDDRYYEGSIPEALEKSVAQITSKICLDILKQFSHKAR